MEGSGCPLGVAPFTGVTIPVTAIIVKPTSGTYERGMTNRLLGVYLGLYG